MADKSEERYLLQVEGLSTARDGREVLSLRSLSLRQGDLVSLIGPNGSGKTTLLSVIAGLLSPCLGSVRIKGQELFRKGKVQPRIRREVVLVHQRPVLFDTSVLSNVAYGLLRRGVDRALARSRAIEALEEAGLGGLAGRAGRTLSGGEQRRVALVRAMVILPSLLLLDEPSAEVDEASLPWLAEAIRKALKSSGVLLATHDKDLAQRLACRVVALPEQS